MNEREPARTVRVLELRSVWGTGGGPEKTILLGAARTDPRRFKVTVCYLRDARDRVFRIDERAHDLGIDYLEIVERNSFDPSILTSLRRLIRDRNIDIVHAHDYKTNFLALLMHRMYGVTPLTTAHGWAGNSGRERAYYFVDRRLIRRFPIAIAVSERIRQTLIRHGANPARVRRIRNGIDHGYYKRAADGRTGARGVLALASDALVLGAVGRLEREKRFDLLIDTASRIRNQRLPTVVIAGEGSCRAALEQKAVALGLGGRLRLLGQRDDVREVHQAFDVYVQTSDTEGIPNAVLEAMAMETPVVATNVGGTGELIDDGIHGLLVTPGNVEALSRAVERTLEDPSGTARRVAAARMRVERELSFDRRTAAVEAIYEELAGRRTH